MQRLTGGRVIITFPAATNGSPLSLRQRLQIREPAGIVRAVMQFGEQICAVGEDVSILREAGTCGLLPGKNSRQ